ncbi:MAG: ATP-dependent DNA helicase RecG [Pseudomonadota bacterium]
MRPDILNSLFKPVSSLEGIGPKLEKNLTRLFHGRETGEPARVAELLFHIPHTVIDRRFQPSIAGASEGTVSTFKVVVDRHYPPPRGNSRVPYRIDVHDETGDMSLVFFRSGGDWLQKTMPVGETRFVSGLPEFFNGKLNMVHPDHMVTAEQFSQMPLLEPVYPLVAGVSSKVLAKAIRSAVKSLPELPEWIDDALLAREKWPGFAQALERIHHPRDATDIDPVSPARRRLAHDELLSGQLALGLLRQRLRKASGKSRQGNNALVDRLMPVLPFELTGAQHRSIAEITSDLEKPERMLRLLQGDVGSGKTVVALVAALKVVECGEQAAIMAPTEILARQHLASIKPLCDQIGVSVRLLTGKDKAADRRETLQSVEAGETDILIGTHALFQASVEFNALGLAVIDEQHRFGVHQRLTLGDKGNTSDVLVMTATPIPRTLVLTAYGDMDVSRLDEKPPGRQPIQTNAISSERVEELIARILGAVTDGQKVYWICPLVEESDEVDAMAASDRHADLQSRAKFPVGLVHGRMGVEEKNAAMNAFKEGETRILVATTVIEVGVDVPDATIMVIEHAERFGLAQLHQLRGRVGRGSAASSCMLLYYGPLSETAKARLKIMRETEDGFRIAEEDLKLRGEGEILGTRQSGTPGFNLASIEHHRDILDMARDYARLVLNGNPELDGTNGEALRIMLYLFGQDNAIRLLRAG